MEKKGDNIKDSMNNRLLVKKEKVNSQIMEEKGDNVDVTNIKKEKVNNLTVWSIFIRVVHFITADFSNRRFKKKSGEISRVN